MRYGNVRYVKVDDIRLVNCYQCNCECRSIKQEGVLYGRHLNRWEMACMVVPVPGGDERPACPECATKWFAQWQAHKPVNRDALVERQRIKRDQMDREEENERAYDDTCDVISAECGDDADDEDA